MCRASLIAQLVKNPPAAQETLVQFLDRKVCCRRDRLPTPVFLGFPCGSAGKESTCNAGGLGSIPGLGRSPGEGKGYPLQYSGLENPTDCIVHGVAKSQTRLSDCHFHFLSYMCEKDTVNRDFETLCSNHMSAFSQMKAIIPLQLLYFPVSQGSCERLYNSEEIFLHWGKNTSYLNPFKSLPDI